MWRTDASRPTFASLGRPAAATEPPTTKLCGPDATDEYSNADGSAPEPSTATATGSPSHPLFGQNADSVNAARSPWSAKRRRAYRRAATAVSDRHAIATPTARPALLTGAPDSTTTTSGIPVQ